MDPFLRQLAELCQAEKTRVKWVFVRSYAIGHTLGERLVVAGCDWANIRFTTPLDVALQMAAPFLVERRLEPAIDTLGPALVMRLLAELPDETPAYFRGLDDTPRMAEALWRTLRELRMAGLRSTDLRGEAFASSAKHAALRAIVQACEAFLEQARFADVAAVYDEALRHLDVCPVLPGDMWIVLPGVIWAPLEQAFLAALPGT